MVSVLVESLFASTAWASVKQTAKQTVVHYAVANGGSVANAPGDWCKGLYSRIVIAKSVRSSAHAPNPSQPAGKPPPP